jgi:PAS domain S-box-containing protein
MKTTSAESDQLLRVRAEEALRANGVAKRDTLAHDELRLFHELQVHQIELEMQNEELRCAKSELEELYARYFDLYDLAPLSYFSLNDIGVILKANLTAATLLGVNRDTLVHQPISLFITAEDRDIFNRHCKLHIESGEPQSFELRMEKMDGTPFWANLTSTIVQNPSLPSGQGEHSADVFRIGLLDITARKQAEKAQREMEERHRAIVHTTMDGYWLMNLQGRLLEVNDTYCRISGYSKQELLDMRTPDLEVAESTAEIASRIQTIMEKGKHKYEARYRNKDGSILDVEVCAQYLPIDGGRIVAFLSDITRRKQDEKELQQKNAEIEQFIYTVSHDLRSPLVTVSTFLGYLEQDMAGNNQERIGQDIAFIRGAAEKMKTLLDELLEMSRIGRLETPPVEVSLRVVLAETLINLGGSIREQKVDIRLPAMDLILFGDRLRLCQIWQNLIENALKYSRDGSIPRIDLGLNQDKGETIFYVKDNGIGIAPQYLKKIFGIFEKLDPSSSGAGMGLAMVQRIVEKSGGRIWVESEGVGKGSCFFFTLPRMVKSEE